MRGGGEGGGGGATPLLLRCTAVLIHPPPSPPPPAVHAKTNWALWRCTSCVESGLGVRRGAMPASWVNRSPSTPAPRPHPKNKAVSRALGSPTGGT